MRKAEFSFRCSLAAKDTRLSPDPGSCPGGGMCMGQGLGWLSGVLQTVVDDNNEGRALCWQCKFSSTRQDVLCESCGTAADRRQSQGEEREREKREKDEKSKRER